MDKGKAVAKNQEDPLPFPNGVEHDLHGPLTEAELDLNLSFDPSGPGQYRVVDAETMTVNPIMTTNPLAHFSGITNPFFTKTTFS